MLNRSKTVFYVVGFLLTAFGLSCQRSEKGEPLPAARYRIVKAAQSAFNLEVTMTYQYDNQGRLMTVNEYPAIADTLAKIPAVARTSVYYDGVNPRQIDRADRWLTSPYRDADGLVSGTHRTFTYDGLGRLATVRESKALNDFKAFALSQTFEYAYGADNLPTSLTVSGGPFQERDVYTYTFVNGNAVHIKLSVTNSRSPTPKLSESDVRFDDAPSVYYHFFAIYPGITSFNKNNVINTNTTLYHDDRGLLVKRVKTGNYIDDVTEYTYETY